MAAPKLSKEARLLVISRIIAGDTNNQIRLALKDAGHPFDLLDQAFSHYRGDKAVKDALERKDAEAVQSGYAQRSERILKLVQSARRFERRLAISPDDASFAAGKTFDLMATHKEYRETLRDIGALVDPVKAQPLTINATVEIISAAAQAADAKFASVVGRSAAKPVLAEPDAAGEGGT